VARLVAVYTRVSREDADEPVSTRRQERACREFAKSKGWDVGEVCEDVDVSAYSRHVSRPAFDQLLRLVAGGRVSGVLVWKLDRLVRRTSDFERFWDRCERAGVFLVSATEPIDSGTELGLAVIRMLVNFASVESTSISLRISSRMQEMARGGRPLWRGRAFGFSSDAQTLVDEEAELIREAASRVIDGATPAEIAKDWHRRRVRTNTGNLLWDPSRVSTILMSHRLVGDNEFKGQVVAKDCFPAVLDRPTHAKVRAVLAGARHPHRRSSPGLLTGLLRCARCGATLHAGKVKRRLASGELSTYRIYKCQAPPTGCGRLNVNADFVEPLVIEAVLCRIEARRLVEPIPDLPADANDRLIEAYGRYSTAVTELTTDYFVHRKLTREEWLVARDGLQHRLHLARRDFDPNWRGLQVRQEAPPRELRTAWSTLEFAHRRDIIASELEFVLVHPTRQRAFFDAKRVEPRWCDDIPVLEGAYPWPNGSRSRMRPWLDPDVVLADEAADLIGISVPQVRVWMRGGAFHGTKAGHHWRFSREEIEDVARRVKGSLGTAEVAEILGVTDKGVVFWIRNGSLPACKVAGRYHIQPDEFRVWSEKLAELISANDAARRLGVSRYWMKKLIESGEVDAISDRVGAKFVNRSQVMAVARRRKVLTEVETPGPGHPDMTGQGRTLSLRTVARSLRCSPRTLRILLKEGLLPGVMIGDNGFYQFSPVDIAIARGHIAEKKPRGRNATTHPRGRGIGLRAPTLRIT
jgi:site-specific DNA recombinase